METVSRLPPSLAQPNHCFKSSPSLLSHCPSYPAPAVFSKAQTLTNAEVYLILEKHQEVKRAEDATWQPSPQMQKVVGYCERFSGTKGRVTATSVKT